METAKYQSVSQREQLTADLRTIHSILRVISENLSGPSPDIKEVAEILANATERLPKIISGLEQLVVPPENDYDRKKLSKRGISVLRIDLGAPEFRGLECTLEEMKRKIYSDAQSFFNNDNEHIAKALGVSTSAVSEHFSQKI